MAQLDASIITQGLQRVPMKTPQEIYGEQLRLRAMQQQIETADALEQERRAQLAKIQQQQQLAQQTGEVLQKGYVNGKYDRALIRQTVPPQMLESVEKYLNDVEEADAKRQKVLGELQLQNAEAFGRSAAAIEAHGFNPGFAALALDTHADQLSPQEKAFAEQLIHQGPEGVKQLVSGWKASAPKQRELAETARGHDLTAAGQALTAQGQANTAAAQAAAREETARHNRETERISALSVGRAEAAQAETARHNAAMEEAARNTKTARPVLAGDAEDLANFDTSLDDLKVLKGSIAGAGQTGTIAKIGAVLPNWVTDVTGWGTDAKKKQALIDRVKQVIGKTLEGGVLRKEDELKYEKILPTIYDTTDVVNAKLDGLNSAIAQRKTRRVDAMEDAGFNVSRYRARETAAPAAQTGPRIGERRMINGQLGEWDGKGWKAVVSR